VLGESPAVPRISDLGHLYSSSLGKLELDLMGSHQMSERQVLDAIVAEAIRIVFEEYVDKHGLAEIAEIFAKGVKIEVGDMLPSSHYAERLKRVPPVWDKAFEVNASETRRCGPPASSSCWPAPSKTTTPFCTRPREIIANLIGRRIAWYPFQSITRTTGSETAPTANTPADRPRPASRANGVSHGVRLRCQDEAFDAFHFLPRCLTKS
jgi:phage tail protein X